MASPPASLCDLGYCSAGLDNNWNKCQSKVAGAEYAYHYNNGSPAVDTSRFPSMSSMTQKAHGLGLTVSWKQLRRVPRKERNVGHV